MARLPIPGQDDEVWGEILNEFLLQSHNEDGTLRDNTVGDAQVSSLSESEITNLNDDLAVRVKKDELMVNVVDFGAKGDGSTDDTTALVDAVAALQPGATLYFPPGDYLVERLYVANLSGFRVLGAGATLTGSDSTKTIVRLSSCSFFEVRGLNVHHAAATTRNSTGYGFNLSGCTDYALTNNVVYGTAAAGILSSGGNRGTVTGNTVRDNLADGIHHTGGSQNISIVGNHTDNTGDDGIAVVSYQADGVVCSNITITGNTVARSKTRGITVVGGKSVTITGNNILSTRSAGLYIAQENSWNSYGVSSVVATGNSIKDANTYLSPTAQMASIHIAGTSSAYPVEGVYIASNMITGGNWRMIYAVAQSQNQVVRLSVMGNFCNGPNTASVGVQFVGVTHSSIVANTVRYTHGTGINIDAACNYVNADHNVVFYPNQGGSANSYGVINSATVGSTTLNVVSPDASRTALLAEVHSVDTSGDIHLRRNLVANQVNAAALKVAGNVGFYNTNPVGKPTVTGSRGGNAALTSLLNKLAAMGLITNSTT
jgi:parallel beta-helix repeat protein